jgi:hypothetical protein
MKIKPFALILGILCLILLIFAQLAKNTAGFALSQLSRKDILISGPKSLSYELYLFDLFLAGNAIIENKGTLKYNNLDAVVLTAKGSSCGLFARFYRSEANFSSYVDKGKLHSLRFVREIRAPNKPVENKEIVYDQSVGIMYIDGVSRKIPVDTQDPFSLLYYLENQNFSINKEFDANINTNQKNYCFKARVIGRDVFVLGNKRIGVWVLKGSIKRRDKTLRHSSAVKAWILDGPSKIPILIKVYTAYGIFTIKLVDVI